MRLMQERGSLSSAPLHKLLSAPFWGCSRIQQGFAFSWELLCDGNALCILLVHISLTLEVLESLQTLAEGPRSHVGRSLAFKHTTLELDILSYKKSSLCHLELCSAGSAHPSAAALGAAAGGKKDEEERKKPWQLCSLREPRMEQGCDSRVQMLQRSSGRGAAATGGDRRRLGETWPLGKEALG